MNLDIAGFYDTKELQLHPKAIKRQSKILSKRIF